MTNPNVDYINKVSMYTINKQINSCIKYIAEIDEERAIHVNTLNTFVKERDIRRQTCLNYTKGIDND